MEELLNKLIEKGWRIENQNVRISDVKYMHGLRELRIVYKTDRRDAVREYPIRFLVSKESNLWQFVCENGMIKEGFEKSWVKNNWKGEYTNSYTTNFNDSGKDDYEYRLIESALCDEDKLEEFLLDNIKIEGKTD